MRIFQFKISVLSQALAFPDSAVPAVGGRSQHSVLGLRLDLEPLLRVCWMQTSVASSRARSRCLDPAVLCCRVAAHHI